MLDDTVGIGDIKLVISEGQGRGGVCANKAPRVARAVHYVYSGHVERRRKPEEAQISAPDVHDARGRANPRELYKLGDSARTSSPRDRFGEGWQQAMCP